MQAIGKASAQTVGLDIKTPIGTIEAPKGIVADAANLDTRLAIAANAFRYMSRNLYSGTPAANTNRLKMEQFYKGNIKATPPMPRRTTI